MNSATQLSDGVMLVLGYSLSTAEMSHHSAQPRNLFSRRKTSMHTGRNTPVAKRQPRTWLQAPTNFYTQAEIAVLSLKGLKTLLFKAAYAGCFVTLFHLIPSCPMSYFSLAQPCADQSGSRCISSPQLSLTCYDLT